MAWFCTCCGRETDRPLIAPEYIRPQRCPDYFCYGPMRQKEATEPARGLPARGDDKS